MWRAIIKGKGEIRQQYRGKLRLTWCRTWDADQLKRSKGTLEDNSSQAEQAGDKLLEMWDLVCGWLHQDEANGKAVSDRIWHRVLLSSSPSSKGSEERLKSGSFKVL